ncbi:[protein-PII] uridylyltransferase [Gilvimarinus sp. F26214L]|uniref:[protein-PII] uridylyltransferase n=1 Tax=Gilvimarinus sp. DZF01 TaxID=3461371 RepID=UPI004045E9D1
MSSIPYFERPLFFFDQSRFREALASGNPLTVFKDAISAANTQFNRRFREGEDIRALVYDRALFVDCIVHYAWYQFDWGEPADAPVSLIAVGGYGRGELHPHSDIDLLVLLDREPSEAYQRGIERFVTLLWDIGLEVGQSVRTIDQTLDIARDDITVATNILECRTIVGPDFLRQRLVELSAPEHMWPADRFFRAKWDEQIQRHNKHNNTEYNLEPNIKNAPGGLRDIQTINWVAKRFFGVRTLRQLEGQAFFTDAEFAILRTGEEFLWKVRYGLHMLAGRPEERLLFDYQRELATLFGYQDTPERLAVEQFMHWYYRIALALGELNEVLMQFLDEAILQKGQSKQVTPINERFQLRDGYIEVTHVKVFEEAPSALLEIFVLMGNNPEIRGPRASTIRLMRENRDRIDDEFRDDPENQQLFMELLRCPYGLFTQLKRMKRYGILGRYLPEFGQVTGQMQHDLFHIYTVDAHTLLVVNNMRRFRHPSAQDEFDVAVHVMKRLPKHELLYIAGLYHDIGKGRGGDHSVLGAVDARRFCERHGLSPRETRLVCWLVEKHLLMSQVSQKQDISDPDVIHNFALEVGDQLHLDYLYALTVADMNATNPDIWNSWRASLMRQLYLETKRALRRGLENTVDKQDIIEETQDAALHKLERKGLDETVARAIWKDMDEDYFLRESHLDIAWHTAAIAKHEGDEPLILIDTTTAPDHDGATQIFIRARERKNVFAAAATCLDQLNLSIQDARIYHTQSGYTVDTFYVLDQHGSPIGDDPGRLKRIHKALLEELSLAEHYSSVIHRRTPRQLKHFSMPTRTSINNDISSGYTVLEVISPDRPGLLARMGRVFIEFDIQLQNAKITTLGERVEDVFYITDENGEPLSDPQLCSDLQREICRQLDEHVEESKHASRM